jgi:hypothetical protein
MNQLNAASIAATLAALGTAALAGCSSQQNAPASPVQAHEVPAASPSGTEPGVEANCSAGSCGAKTDTAPAPAEGEASCSSTGAEGSCGAKDTEGSCGTKPASDAGASGSCGAKDSEATAQSDPPAAPASPTMKAAAPRPAKTKIPNKSAGAKGGCGAGTCG